MKIKPMLAKKFNGRNMTFPCFMQPKLNGIRAMWLPGVGLVSRDGKRWSDNILPHIMRDLEGIDRILDGELYVHGMSLQEINSRVAVKRVVAHPNVMSVQYHVFDVVQRRPFLERAETLKGIPYTENVRPVLTISGDQELAQKAFTEWKRRGFEGQMLRDPMAFYGLPEACGNKENRWRCLLKRKDWLDMLATVRDVVEGKGKFENTTGALVVEGKGKTFRVGSGRALTNLSRIQLWIDRKNVPGMLVRVKYEMLSDDGVPLKPTLEELDVIK